jgi:transcriptional regulator with XRE-family HTH domain
MRGIDIGEAGAARLAAAVKAARARLGLTQQQVADRSQGVLAKSTLQTIEGGRRTSISQRTLQAICRSLDWTDDSAGAVIAGHEPSLRPASNAAEIRAALDEIKSGLGRLEGALDDR